MWNKIEEFEKAIAEFYGAPYAVSTDCCTHAIELSLRLRNYDHVTCPAHTYISIPMTFEKLGLPWNFVEDRWNNFYHIGGTNIIDGAVYWRKDGYIPGKLICLSFQFRKHLNLGRGGMILCDSKDDYIYLKKMSYDGRLPDIAWAEQDIDMMGYHYYMTPETAQLGLEKLPSCIEKESRCWSWKDYPDISKMKVFNAE